MDSLRRHLHSFLSWLQRHSPAWPIGLEVVLGLTIGAAALLSLKGVTGATVCFVSVVIQ